MQQSPLYQEWQQEAELRGRQEGRQAEKLDVARSLLEHGIPLETIVLATKLTIEQIQQLRQK
jgi:predicted transposase/invertase (TIGR01784 family)